MNMKDDDRQTSVARFWKLVGRRESEKRARPGDRGYSGWGRHLRGSGWRGTRLRVFAADEKGSETVEYAILAGLALLGTAAVAILGIWIVRTLRTTLPH